MKEVILYTDGACRNNPGNGAIGIVLIYKSHEKHIKKAFCNTTNNKMELLAVIEGLKALNQPCKVSVYTDSKYVKNAFTEKWIDNWQKNGWKNSKKKQVKNKELWLELLKLLEKHDVNFYWVKGHNGNRYNELCDKLANEALDELENKNL